LRQVPGGGRLPPTSRSRGITHEQAWTANPWGQWIDGGRVHTLETSERGNERKDDTAMNEPEPKENRTPAIAGLAIAVVLLVVGLWLARELTAASKMQDCLMSGRTNCNQIQPQ